MAGAVVAPCGAAAQQFSVSSEPVVVADELFGAEVRLDFDDAEGFRPVVALDLDGARTLVPGTAVTIGFHLSNARFARHVSFTDLAWVAVVPSGAAVARRPVGDEVTVAKSGGRRNGRSVWFTVEVAAVVGRLRDLYFADGAWHGAQRGIDFRLPDLVVHGLGRMPLEPAPVEALARVTVEQERGTGIAEAVSNPLCGRGPGHPGMREGCTVVRAESAIAALVSTPGAGAAISPDAGTRHLLVGADGEPLAAQETLLAELRLAFARARPVRDADGTVLDDFEHSLSGELVVAVASEHFRPGDTVYADLDGDGRADADETFALDGREAVYAAPLTTEPFAVLYVPNGSDPLRHGASFATSARIAFRRAGNREVGIEPTTLALRLRGIARGGAKAYAIAPPTSTDTTNLRATCESSAADCRVFLQCRDRDGVEMFGNAGTVAPGGTARWNQAEIAAVLGEAWTGRLSCEVLSDGPVSVQVLTRASGVLANNTPVSTQ